MHTSQQFIKYWAGYYLLLLVCVSLTITATSYYRYRMSYYHHLANRRSFTAILTFNFVCRENLFTSIQLALLTTKRHLGLQSFRAFGLAAFSSRDICPTGICWEGTQTRGIRRSLDAVSAATRHSFTPSWRRVSIIAMQSSPRLRRQQTGYNEC